MSEGSVTHKCGLVGGGAQFSAVDAAVGKFAMKLGNEKLDRRRVSLQALPGGEEFCAVLADSRCALGGGLANDANAPKLDRRLAIAIGNGARCGEAASSGASALLLLHRRVLLVAPVPGHTAEKHRDPLARRQPFLPGLLHAPPGVAEMRLDIPMLPDCRGGQRASPRVLRQPPAKP
jgi:hypothetical protein